MNEDRMTRLILLLQESRRRNLFEAVKMSLRNVGAERLVKSLETAKKTAERNRVRQNNTTAQPTQNQNLTLPALPTIASVMVSLHSNPLSSTSSLPATSSRSGRSQQYLQNNEVSSTN